MPSKTPTGPSPAAQKARILERAEAEKVKFLRLQFTEHPRDGEERRDPDRQFEDALNGEIMFDGSSIEGFVRIEESDMYPPARPRYVRDLSVAATRAAKRWRG